MTPAHHGGGSPAVSTSDARPRRRGQFTGTVAANIPLCREHFRLVLKVQGFPQTRPGQFIQIACRDLNADYSEVDEYEWEPGEVRQHHGLELEGPLAVLRRPFSLAGRRDVGDSVELDIIHRIVGAGTAWMAKLEVGAEVGILGPLGNWFEQPKGDGQAVLVGGGVGIPPMIYWAEALKGRKAVVFSGALTK